MNEDDYGSLPPRREKHGNKQHEPDPQISNLNQKPQSFRELQEGLNSRLERRKALKAFTLNPQGYRDKAIKPKQKKEKTKRNKKKRKWSAGLIVANVILGLFLLLIGTIFFFILYNY
ncbi:MAG: hypothetical protein ACO1OC_10230 [Tuberibacillus sp.]